MSRILLTLFLSIGILFGFTNAQNQYEKTAMEYLQSNFSELGLNKSDIEDIILVDAFSTQHNGATHFYFQQRHEQIKVFNALLNVTITKKGKVMVTGNTFIPNAHKSIKSKKARINPDEAINNALVHLNPTFVRSTPVLKEQLSDYDFLYDASSLSNSDIPVRMMYVPDPQNEELILCWNIELDMKENADFWNVNIDAKTGEFHSKLNYTTYCSFDQNSFAHFPNPNSKKCHKHEHDNRSTLAVSQEASYKVFPLPAESPNHGEHTILVDPQDTLASPFGWHDNNGVEGAEFTITRGNNVHAYLDEFDNNSPSSPEPDGGENMEFIYDFDPDAEPDALKNAAVVNLFYVNNRVHDLLYRLGFDEYAGNFQDNNYGKGGQQNDYVRAEAFDGGGDNNANFSTPSDGNNGRMQMYIWNSSDELRLEINEPVEIGGLYETGKALADGPTSFGPDMDQMTIQGDVVLAFDNTNKPNLGCGTIQNTDEIDGNIALIDRGVCEFGSKVRNAENAGAIAVLICNVEGVNGGTGDEIINMSPGAEGGFVNIPSLFVKKTTCDLIKIAIAEEKNVNVTMGLQQLPGPSERAGSFDNGVITHEYVHGLSTRLTGGPSNSGCLFNIDVNGDGAADGEQMGEGWSDFYALAFTTKAGDLGEDGRGIGTYVSGQLTTGRGIRHYPYSTDMGISPVTYDYIKSTNIPHGVGEVFAAALWDMYWKFIEMYGFDEDWTNTESGNFKALLLVTDALKIQACNPGFLDGRDAILDADIINFDGAHECMIWEVFARRGMGYFAEQGNPFDHRDGTENFEPKPTCIPELKITEEITTTIKPGDSLAIKVTVTNHKVDSVTNVIVVEDLPEGLSFISGSANYPVTESDGKLNFEIGTLQSLEEVELNYELLSDWTNYSETVFLDEMEVDDGNWIGLNNVGDDTWWELVDYKSHSGDFSWYVIESENESDLALWMLHDPILIEGEAPALSFYHSFNTEVLTDGGFVEYSIDSGDSWDQFKKEDFLLNPYTGGLSYSTIAIPGLHAFYGDSEGFIQSFIDLSFLEGQEVIFSFRYGTDDNTIVDADYPGWFVDDVEIVNLKKYNRQICVTSAEDDNICKSSEVLIDTKLPDAVNESISTDVSITLGPNPSSNSVNIYVSSENEELAELSIFSVDGKLLRKESLFINQGTQRHSLDLNELNNGIYWIAYRSASTDKVLRLVVQ